MPLGIRFFAIVWGTIGLAVGIGYLASPRFVEWTLNRDRTGQRWVRWLGHERAAFAMRYIFSAILIGFGASSLCIGLMSD